MAILSINQNLAGQVGVEPSIVFVDTNDSISTVTSTGFLNGAVKNHGIQITESDIVLCTTLDPVTKAKAAGAFGVSIANGDITLGSLSYEFGLKGLQVLTTGSGNYTPSADVKSIMVEAVGGGGSGGGVTCLATEYAAGGAGGSGAYCKKFYSSVSGSYSYIVGEGGIGGVGGADGSNGADTIFDVMTAGGGEFGQSNTGGTPSAGEGGAGGIASGGDINMPGNAGGRGIIAPTAFSQGTYAAPSFFGGMVKTPLIVPVGSLDGVSAVTNTGAGGSGAVNAEEAASKNGGNGGSGIIIIYEYV